MYKDWAGDYASHCRKFLATWFSSLYEHLCDLDLYMFPLLSYQSHVVEAEPPFSTYINIWRLYAKCHIPHFTRFCLESQSCWLNDAVNTTLPEAHALLPVQLPLLKVNKDSRRPGASYYLIHISCHLHIYNMLMNLLRKKVNISCSWGYVRVCTSGKGI